MSASLLQECADGRINKQSDERSNDKSCGEPGAMAGPGGGATGERVGVVGVAGEVFEGAERLQGKEELEGAAVDGAFDEGASVGPPGDGFFCDCVECVVEVIGGECDAGRKAVAASAQWIGEEPR